MTDIAKHERMLAKLNSEVERWLPDGATVLWNDEKFHEGDYLQKHVFAVDPEDGAITILRAWLNGEDGSPAVSVDLSLPYETFSGEIDEYNFPHSVTFGEKDPLELFFRERLSGEQVEIVWQNGSDKYSSFIARSAKVNREEHVVAGTVTVENGIASVDIGLRQELAALKPEVRRGMGR